MELWIDCLLAHCWNQHPDECKSSHHKISTTKHTEWTSVVIQAFMYTSFHCSYWHLNISCKPWVLDIIHTATTQHSLKDLFQSTSVKCKSCSSIAENVILHFEVKLSKFTNSLLCCKIIRLLPKIANFDKILHSHHKLKPMPQSLQWRFQWSSQRAL